MKKKLGILLAVMILVTAMVSMFSIVAIAEDVTESDTITVSYMNTQDTTSDTTSLDTKAYSGGKQVVAKGEKFTLPTTSSSSYSGQEGFQIVWYTENGRTYKAGEEISFDEDTKLFRCVAKECYSMAEISTALQNESSAAILMADIEGDAGIGVMGRGQSVLILNGYDITITKNSSNFMGAQRSGKHIYGEGTINAVNPDGKLGSYYFFQDQSHGYDGVQNKTVIGVDVTINAPTMWLGSDGDGSYNNHYPWTRIYGTVECYGLYTITNVGNRAPFIEIFDSATVTVNGPRLFWDVASSKCNNQAFDFRIYGGTFNLPAEAANEAFWSNDNVESVTSTDGKSTYPNKGLNQNNKDSIMIFGGVFNVDGGAAPGIENLLSNEFLSTIPSGGNGLVTNNNASTYHVAYMHRPGYKLVFEKYAAVETLTKLTVTDYVDGSLSGTYYFTVTLVTLEGETNATIDTITVYEDAEGTVVTDKFKLDFGMGSCVLFSNSITQEKMKLQAIDSLYAVVPYECEHSYAVDSTVEADCVSLSKNIYKCSVCGDTFTATFGTKLDHEYALISDIPASSTSAGLKTYECTMCGKILTQTYSFDPADIDIEVVVNTENGEQTLIVKGSDVLNLTVTEAMGTKVYTLVGVKDFGEYLATDIVSIEIPIGVSEINFEANSTLKTLKIADYANTNVVSFKNTAITKIYIGAATVSFKNGCSNNVIQGIYSDVSGANVDFDASVFNGKKTITELTYSAGSSYKFNTNSFKEVQVKELIFPDYCTVNFSGEAAFYNCAVEYLYIGLGNPTLAGKPFDYCQKMQKIVLMDVNKITGDYTFCVENAGEKPVEVYIHSETMSLTSNTFYQCHGIIVYTNAPLTTGFNACNAKNYGGVDYPAYTIYYGIGHKYTEGTTDPTCTADGSVGYVTDCPCGKVDEYKEYKVFKAALTNASTYETGTISTTVIPALGHSEDSAIVDMVYEDYFKNARATYLCPVCEKQYFEELLDSALFTERGYSASETDIGSISYTLRANQAAIAAYAPFATGDLKYGLLVSATTDTSPILGIEDGKIVNSNGTVIFEFSDTSFNLIQMKLTGIEDMEFIACGFIMEGDRALYLGQDSTSAAYSVITHAIVLEMIPKEEEPSEE